MGNKNLVGQGGNEEVARVRRVRRWTAVLLGKRRKDQQAAFGKRLFPGGGQADGLNAAGRADKDGLSAPQ